MRSMYTASSPSLRCPSLPSARSSTGRASRRRSGRAPLPVSRPPEPTLLRTVTPSWPRSVDHAGHEPAEWRVPPGCRWQEGQVCRWHGHGPAAGRADRGQPPRHSCDGGGSRRSTAHCRTLLRPWRTALAEDLRPAEAAGGRRRPPSRLGVVTSSRPADRHRGHAGMAQRIPGALIADVIGLVSPLSCTAPIPTR